MEELYEIQTVIHIGFLNYTRFPETPEFYATYMLLKVKNHQLFSIKIRIGVVNLNQTELATEEDRFYGIDQWVALFKYNNEDSIRYPCYAREDYQKMLNTIRRTEKE